VELNDNRGQASVELIAAIPLLAIFVVLIWQSFVAVRAATFASAAARAAARAVATAHDPRAAAVHGLPAGFGRRLRLEQLSSGAIRASFPVPLVLDGQTELGQVESTSRLPGVSQ
jgi:hypothetical protein